MNKASKIILLFSIAFHFAGHSQKAKYVVNNPGTFIKVLPHHFPENYSTIVDAFRLLNQANDQRNDTIFVGMDSGFYKSNTEDILFLLQKDGHRMQTELVTLEKVRRNNKRFVLKKTAALPFRKKDEAYVLVENVDLRVARKNFSETYYESYADLDAHRVDRVVHSDRDIVVEKTIFRDLLNTFLISTHYIDTTEALNLNAFDQLKLKISITAINEHLYNEFCILELRSKIKFENVFSGKPVEKEYTGFSNINYNANNRKHIEDALVNTLLQFFKDPEMSRYFKNAEKELKKQTDSLPEIQIKNTNTLTTNLENATNAVVTVVLKNGHGSGCIVSNDGYIVTNYHVAGNDTSNLYVIFNSGAKKRCRYIRGNPVYDLALLKVDTTIAIPLTINLSKSISVGADVYAIGTPQNINLGQSISKGIISAKRNIQDKIYIQSDVSVNGGNSGGALTNKEGELIGIVNAKLIGNNVEGVSFAIPASYIEEFLRLKIVK